MRRRRSSFAAAALGFLRRKRKDWDKTEHTRALSLAEAEAIRGRS